MASNDTIHFWYNPKTKMYEEGTEMGPTGAGDYGPVYTPPVKKHLEDGGTRFAHLNDLTDYLNDGLVAVTNSLIRYENDSDKERKKTLEGALKLIGVYQEQMANYAGQKWDFNKMLDTYVPLRGTLDAIRADKKKAAEDKKNAAIKAAQEGKHGLADSPRLLAEGERDIDGDAPEGAGV